MEIIPVIDLKGGQAVHARKGERQAYRPVQSPLCPDSAPLAVVRSYLELYPFRTLYVADLDAILRQGDNLPALEAVAAAYPDLSLWVDSGLGNGAAYERWATHGFGIPVIGSESLSDLGLLEQLAVSTHRFVLSLDFRGDGFLGPADLQARPELWPEDIIIMTLARVGSGDGPDLARLQEIGAAAPKHRHFAAGGLRDAADLDRLETAGASGVLVASALHDGRLTAAQIHAASESRP